MSWVVTSPMNTHPKPSWNIFNGNKKWSLRRTLVSPIIYVFAGFTDWIISLLEMVPYFLSRYY